MQVFIDLDSQSPIVSPGVQSIVSTLNFKRGATASIAVQFTKGAAVVELPSDAVGIFGVKQTGHYDDSYVTSSPSWVKSGTGSNAVYTFSLSFVTAALDALFMVDSNLTNDVPSLTLMGEFQWTTGGTTNKTPTIAIIVANDINRSGQVASQFLGANSTVDLSGFILFGGGLSTPAHIPTSQTIFVATTGNDGTGARGNPALPFLTIAAATAATGITSGDLIKAGPGTFVETRVKMPDGVNFYAAGIDVTFIQSAAAITNSADGVIFAMGSNMVARDFTIVGTAASGIFQGPIGQKYNAANGQTDFHNSVLVNVKTVAASDGLYVKPNVSSDLRCFNCVFLSTYDGVNVFAGAMVDCYNCYSASVGPSTIAGAKSRAIACTGGSLKWFGGTLIANSNATASGYNTGVASVVSAASTVEVYGASINVTAGTGTNPTYDVYEDTGGSLLVSNLVRPDGGDIVIFGTVSFLAPTPIFAGLNLLTGKFQATTIAAGRPTLTKTANYTILGREQNAVLTNAGAAGTVIFSLPVAVPGLIYSFFVNAAQTLEVLAGASTTIRISPLQVTAAGGNITANTIGCSITLFAISSTQWISLSHEGTWTAT